MNLLRRLKLRRVALVEAGANPGAHISLFKGKRLADGGYDLGEDENPREEPLVTKTADELQADLEKAEQAKTDAEAKAKAAEEKAAEVEKKLSETSDAELEKAREEIAKLKADAEKAESTDVRKELDELKADNEKLRKADRRSTFIEKAKTFEKLGQPEQLATLLDEADDNLSDPTKKILDSVLKAANEAVEVGKLFAQLSDPDAEPDEGWEERLEKAAKERVAKSDSGLTIEQAKVQIMHEDADLAADYAKSRS